MRNPYVTSRRERFRLPLHSSFLDGASMHVTVAHGCWWSSRGHA